MEKQTFKTYKFYMSDINDILDSKITYKSIYVDKLNKNITIEETTGKKYTVEIKQEFNNELNSYVEYIKLDNTKIYPKLHTVQIEF